MKTGMQRVKMEQVWSQKVIKSHFHSLIHENHTMFSFGLLYTLRPVFFPSNFVIIILSLCISPIGPLIATLGAENFAVDMNDGDIIRHCYDVDFTESERERS